MNDRGPPKALEQIAAGVDRLNTENADLRARLNRAAETCREMHRDWVAAQEETAKVEEQCGRLRGRMAETEKDSNARLGALIMVAWRLTILGRELNVPETSEVVRKTVRDWLEDVGATAPKEVDR